MLADRPLIIAYDGKGVAHLFVDGKVYGDGITGILFEHNGSFDVKTRITVDDVNVVGSNEMDDVFAFRMMLDRILKAVDKEQASTST